MHAITALETNKDGLYLQQQGCCPWANDLSVS